MSLLPCTSLWGESTLYERDPSVSEVHDVVYVPFQAHETWGVFDSSGQIVEATVNFRGRDKHTSAQSITAHFNPDHIGEPSPDDVYIYGGRINPHFGHFLIDVLPRFWRELNSEGRRVKILCHDTNAPENWFRVPFMASIFGALGLGPENFVVFDRLMRIPRLIVPHTSLREQAYVHRAFGPLCQSIGAKLADVSDSGSARPAYLSKTRLTSGVGRVVNEQAIVNVLEARGVEIIFPEQLSIAEQIRLFAQDRIIMGTAGSAFHTSVFAPPRSRLIIVSPISAPNSNFVLLDRLNGNRAEYFYPEGAAVTEPDGVFLTSFNIPDPRSVARDLLDIAARA